MKSPGSEAHHARGTDISRVAVVTGAASGIGLAISRRLAQEGRPVGLLDLNGTAVNTLADELASDSSKVVAAAVDVTNRPAVDAALRRIRDELGPVEILVTSAGLDAFDKLADITPEKWDRILAVNLTGTFHCIQATVPDMRAAGWGRIVTISSSAAPVRVQASGPLRRFQRRCHRADQGASA